jgi:hypothetical protein
MAPPLLRFCSSQVLEKNPMKLRLTSCMLALTLLLSVAGAGAATLNQTFMNDFESNTLYLWSLDASDMSLKNFTAGANMAGWKMDESSPAHMVLSGPTVAAGAGRFKLLMNYKAAPFRLEWAEVFFEKGINVVRGFGTLTFNGNGWSNANVGTHVIDIPLQPRVAATPLPGSALLLMSALALGVWRGRRARCSA